MTTVYEQGVTPCGAATSARVVITLWGAGQPIAGRDTVNGTLIQGECIIFPDSSGYWSADLSPNSDISPQNTTYRVLRQTGCQEIVTYISVPNEEGPVEVGTIEGDPMNDIAPSALSSHADDLDLHGGGIEVAYADITTSVEVTGTSAGFGEAMVVPGLFIEVPDLNRPIWIEGRIHVSAPSSTITATGLLAVLPTSPDVLVGLLDALDGASQKSVPVDVSVPVTLPTFGRRLPPHSPNTYCIAARAAATPFRVNVVASVFTKCWIRATAH